MKSMKTLLIVLCVVLFVTACAPDADLIHSPTPYQTGTPASTVIGATTGTATATNTAAAGPTPSPTPSPSAYITEGGNMNTQTPTTNPTSTLTTTPTAAPTPRVTPTPTAAPTPTPAVKKADVVQKPALQDYSYAWWPEGFKGSLRDLYIRTGYYGLSLDTKKGMINRMGAFTQPVSETEALDQSNTAISVLPACSMDYSVKIGSTTYKFSGVEAAERYNSGEAPGYSFPVSNRMLESGRYMQRQDLMYLKFSGLSNLVGRMEVACSPEHFGLTFEVFSYAAAKEVTLELSVTLDKRFSKATWSNSNQTLTITDDTGYGFVFSVPKGSGASIKLQGTTITFTGKQSALPKESFKGFGVLVMPAVNAGKAQAEKKEILDNNITVTASQIMPNAGRKQKVTYDSARGYYTISLDNMFTKSGPDFEGNLDVYDHLRFTITNTGDTAVKVPIQFIKNPPMSITGLSPMLRDAKTGEPIGVQVQLTKNWHYYSVEPNGVSDNVPLNSPRRYWEGQWFHGYTLIEVPAHTEVTYDYTCTFAQWGGVYAASHAQLCLAGWGGGQQWETAAIGSFGESFCYDIARSWTWCNMGDICPLALYSRIDNQKYNWTGNIGGGDFLFYYDSRGIKVNWANVRTRFKKQGPNLTEVNYSAITADNAVKVEITVYLPRTNDISHAYQHFKYTFLKDVSFSRMAFYQFGADSYNYDFWGKMAVGNNDGVATFKVGGKTYSGEFDTPRTRAWGEYLNNENMNQIEIGGTGLWGALLKGQRGHSYGNKLMKVHEYKAVINGKTYTQPALSIRTTNVMDIWKGALYELNPPKEAGNTIKKGSVVEGIVDYMCLPIQKSDYYGNSPAIMDYPQQDIDNWQFAYYYAKQSTTVATAKTGTVLQNNPTEIRTTGAKDGVIAEITIKGGLGYVPITFKNVPAYSGWRLQTKVGANWVDVDQSVHGNDYWQAWFDAETSTYELTFNVEHLGKDDERSYRLIKK